MKKFRKQFSKLNFEEIENVTNISIRDQTEKLFIVKKPRVLNYLNSYIVFGQIEILDKQQNKI